MNRYFRSIIALAIDPHDIMITVIIALQNQQNIVNEFRHRASVELKQNKHVDRKETRMPCVRDEGSWIYDKTIKTIKTIGCQSSGILLKP